VANAVADALRQTGWDTQFVPAAPPVDDLLAQLEASEPDVVFNLIEGFGGLSAGATWMTALLELAGVSITGSPSAALALCQSKARTKALLRGFGLPTASFQLVGPAEPVPDWNWAGPVIVKPDEEDGSLGIDQGSVVTDVRALGERIERLRDRYGGSVLVESYLPGPEFNVGVLGIPDLESLPVAEIVYEPANGTWPILTYASKWDAGSAEDLASRPRCPAQIDPVLSNRLARLACAACAATACRDYARVDFRLDDRGEPMILEVNPNPDIGPGAGWARALRASGRDYGATLDALARQALNRRPLSSFCTNR
jgi:D-alanine-D-alanine ligase